MGVGGCKAWTCNGLFAVFAWQWWRWQVLPPPYRFTSTCFFLIRGEFVCLVKRRPAKVLSFLYVTWRSTTVVFLNVWWLTDVCLMYSYDFAFLDADKRMYHQYYEMLLQLVCKSGQLHVCRRIRLIEERFQILKRTCCHVPCGIFPFSVCMWLRQLSFILPH